MTAPIAGRLTSDLPHKGEFIEKPITVTLIDALLPDRRKIVHFDNQYTVAKERADLARKQLAAIAVADAEFAKRTQIFRDGMIVRLGHARNETEAEKTGCLAEAGQRRDVGAQMQQLVKAGTASPMRTAEALAILGSTSTRCDMADARLQRLQSELASAKEGVFLGDGANDAPYSQQQRDRLSLRRQELETMVLEESLQASQAAAEAAEERKYFDRLSHFDLTLPANYVVWSVPASPGTTVSEGQTLLDLAACEHRFVDVELPERDFEKTRVVLTEAPPAWCGAAEASRATVRKYNTARTRLVGIGLRKPARVRLPLSLQTSPGAAGRRRWGRRLRSRLSICARRKRQCRR